MWFTLMSDLPQLTAENEEKLPLNQSMLMLNPGGRRIEHKKGEPNVRWLAMWAYLTLLLTCGVNLAAADDQTAEACKILNQYMAKYYALYQASGHKTNPQEVANLKAGTEHKLMDLGISFEVFVALARYEFACRACFYLEWSSECEQIPNYQGTLMQLAGCIE